MKNKGQAKKGTMKRLIRMLFEFYPVLLPLVLVCSVLNALISSIPAIFQQNIIAVVEQYWQTKFTHINQHVHLFIALVALAQLCIH